jgi:hypothetical protein
MSETSSDSDSTTHELQTRPITSDLFVSFARPNFPRQEAFITDSVGVFVLRLFSWLEKLSTWKREQSCLHSAARDEHETNPTLEMPDSRPRGQN